MAARYTAMMSPRHPSLPLVWLLSDARNDAVLERALAALPPQSGFVFRHYHLDEAARRARFGALAAQARALGHRVVLAGDAGLAVAWGADGVYGAASLAARGLLRLAAAHDGGELAAANAAGVDGVFLSPVFATRSHPDARTLGVFGFNVLAQQSAVPVIALGGMTARRAQRLAWPRWGAIDGLAPAQAA